MKINELREMSDEQLTLTVQETEQSLFRLQISQFWLDAVLGLLILIAVASDAVILRRLRSLWARAEQR